MAASARPRDSPGETSEPSLIHVHPLQHHHGAAGHSWIDKLDRQHGRASGFRSVDVADPAPTTLSARLHRLDLFRALFIIRSNGSMRPCLICYARPGLPCPVAQVRDGIRPGIAPGAGRSPASRVDRLVATVPGSTLIGGFVRRLRCRRCAGGRRRAGECLSGEVSGRDGVSAAVTRQQGRDLGF